KSTPGTGSRTGLTPPWIPFGTNPTLSGPQGGSALPTARDPFNRTWNTTKIVFPSGAGGVRQVSTTLAARPGPPPQGQHAIAYLWVKAATGGNRLTLAVHSESGTIEEGSTTVTVGSAWQKIRAECFFTAAAGG